MTCLTNKTNHPSTISVFTFQDTTIQVYIKLLNKFKSKIESSVIWNCHISNWCLLL